MVPIFYCRQINKFYISTNSIIILLNCCFIAISDNNYCTIIKIVKLNNSPYVALIKFNSKIVYIKYIAEDNKLAFFY